MCQRRWISVLTYSMLNFYLAPGMLFVCCCSVERRSKIDGVDVAWARWTYRSVLWKTGSGEPYAINRSKSTWSYRGRCTVTNFTGLDLKFWHGVVHALIDTLAAGPFSFFSREIWPIRRAKKYKSYQSWSKKTKIKEVRRPVSLHVRFEYGVKISE